MPEPTLAPVVLPPVSIPQRPSAPAGGRGGARLASLDVFRGLVIVLMFVVNLSGDRSAFPAWMGHAGWNNGLHGQGLADFVFPWFLFIVGVSVPFSMASSATRGVGPGTVLTKAVRRGLVLYALGLLVMFARTSMDSLAWDAKAGALVPVVGKAIGWGSFWFWDILPLLGLASVVCVVFGGASVTARVARGALIVAVLGFKVWALGRVGPGFANQPGFSWRESSDMYVKIGGWFGQGEERMVTADVATALKWVSVGITQGLPACATALLGVFAGEWLRARALCTHRRAAGLLLGGGVLTTAGCLLAWVFDHPFSKDFFSSSFVLLSAGTAAMALGGLHLVLDGGAGGFTRPAAAAARVPEGSAEAQLPGGRPTGRLGPWGGRPLGLMTRAPFSIFEVMGKNAIAIYFAGEMLWTMVFMRWRIAGPDGSGQVLFVGISAWLKHLSTPVAGPWLATCVYVALWWLLARWLWSRGWIIRV